MKILRYTFFGLAGLLLLVAAAAAAGMAWLQTEGGRRWLTTTIQDAASTPEAPLTLGTLSGQVPFDWTVSAVSMADRDGVWLTLHDVHLALDPWALLQRRVTIRALTAARIAVERPPAPSQVPAPPPQTQTALRPDLPKLPLTIVLERLAVDELRLGKALLGGEESAVLRVDANARLSAGGDGLDATLTVARIDNTPGRVAVTLAFAPDSRQLTVDLKASEPEGGVIAHMLAIPGLPPVEATLDGQGTLADWTGRLNATAGAVVNLTADATVKAQPGGYAVTLASSGDVARLLPAPAGDLVGPKPSLDAALWVGADGGLELRPLTLTTAAGAARLTGSLGADHQRLSLQAEVVAGADSAAHPLTPVRWRDARVTLSADGTLADLAFAIDARLTGVGSDDPGLAAAVGPELRLEAKGAMQPDGGRVRLDGLALTSAAGALTVDGVMAGWGREADATLRLALADLSTLSGLAKRPLAGSVALEGPITVREGAVRAALDGRVTALNTGTAADEILGNEVRLTLKAATEPNGMVRLDDLRVEGDALSLTASAALAEGRLEANATLALPQLAPIGEALESPMDGGVTLDLTARGPLNALEVLAHAVGRDLVLQGRRLGATELTVTAADLPATPHGGVQVTSHPGEAGLAASIAYALNGDTLRLSDLSVTNGPNTIKGAIAVALDTLMATGRLEGIFPALPALSGLAGVGLEGDAGFVLALDAKDGKQTAGLTANARGLKVMGADGPLLSSQKLTLSADVADALGAASGKARVEMQSAVLAGAEIAAFTAGVDGGLGKARFQASGTGAGSTAGSLDMAGIFEQEAATRRVRLERFQLSAAGETLRLAQPAGIEIADRRYVINGLQLVSGGARLTADVALSGDQMKGSVRVDQLPLALARLFDPALRVDGALNATAALSGTVQNPHAELSVRVAGLRSASAGSATDSAALPSLDATLNAQWQGRQVNANGTVAARGGDARLTLRAAAPLVLDPETLAITVPERGKLDAGVSGTIQLSLLNDLLAASGDRAKGMAAIDVQVGGTMAKPQLGGSVTLSGGRYENRASGAVITDIAARLIGSGDVFTLQSFTARTQGGGTLAAEGVIRPSAHEARQIDLRVRAVDARLLQTDMITARIGANLTLAGSFAASVLAGTVTIEEAEVQIPDRMPPNVVDLKVVEVGRGVSPPTKDAQAPPTQARPAQQAASRTARPQPGRKPGARAKGAPVAVASPPTAAGPIIGLDLSIAANNRIFVRGHGLVAEFGGQLKVAGTVDRPEITGRFSMLKGTLDLLSKIFTFEHGFIDFDGGWPIDPRLDLLASATANQVTAQVQISGTAKQPKLELTSPQGLPQDEVLARVLFGKSTGSLSALEAVQLAQSAATLVGLGGGTSVVDKVRQMLGIDRLEFNGGENGKGGSVEAGRYVSDRVYVGVEQGIGAGGASQSRAKVEIDLFKNFKAEAGVGVDAETRFGFKFEWNY